MAVLKCKFCDGEITDRDRLCSSCWQYNPKDDKSNEIPSVDFDIPMPSVDDIIINNIENSQTDFDMPTPSVDDIAIDNTKATQANFDMQTQSADDITINNPENVQADFDMAAAREYNTEIKNREEEKKAQFGTIMSIAIKIFTFFIVISIIKTVVPVVWALISSIMPEDKNAEYVSVATVAPEDSIIPPGQEEYMVFDIGEELFKEHLKPGDRVSVFVQYNMPSVDVTKDYLTITDSIALDKEVLCIYNNEGTDITEEYRDIQSDAANFEQNLQRLNPVSILITLTAKECGKYEDLLKSYYELRYFARFAE